MNKNLNNSTRMVNVGLIIANHYLEIADFIINDKKIDKDEKNIMICDSEEHLDELEIKHDMYNSSEYAKEYSKKQHFSELQRFYSESRAKQLIDYIIDQLKNIDEIEVWSIWLDERESASIRTVNVNELSITDISFLDLSNGFIRSECLIIKK